jgi:hypothetical protein
MLLVFGRMVWLPQPVLEGMKLLVISCIYQLVYIKKLEPSITENSSFLKL